MRKQPEWLRKLNRETIGSLCGKSTTQLPRRSLVPLEVEVSSRVEARKVLTNDVNDGNMGDMKSMAENEKHGQRTYLGGDSVKHPSHYNHGKMEVIDIIDAFPHLNYNLLVALKYILRAPYKGRQEDLRKAIHHLEHMIELMDKGELGYSRQATYAKPSVTE